MHYYSFHVSDYIHDTAHLSAYEDLAFRRLLDLYYTSEKPIPNKTQEVSRRIRMSNQSNAVQTVLEEFFMFDKENDCWFHKRCDKAIADYQAKAERNREVGKLGGRPKVNPDGNPNKTQVVSKDNPNQEPRTNNHISVSKDTGDKPPLSTDEIIFSYGVPLLTNAGTPEKSARSFLGGLRKSHGDEALVNTLRDCIKAKPMQPLEWLAKALPPNGIKKNPADIIHTTVPGTKELDPVLVKIMEDEKKAAPIPDFVRQFNKKIKGEA
jgi:uncharacterized protein YdaU (DUF1376 family)